MGRVISKRSVLSIAVVVLGTAGAGGCAGGDQIEFQGKIFEMAGLTNREKKDKVPEERAPLVIPPTKQLPEPGPRQAAAEPPQNWPADPDEIMKNREAEEKKRLEEYYRHGDFTDKAGIEEFEYFTNQRSRRPGMASKTANEIIETGREKAAAEEAAQKKAAQQAAQKKTADAAGDGAQETPDDGGWNTKTETVDPDASPPIQLPPSH